MTEIYYYDRTLKKKVKEKVYGKIFLEILYGDQLLSKILSKFILPIITKIPLFSSFYGAFQKTSLTRKKIAPFIRKYEIDANEFLEDWTQFRSFNDFFIRKLKPSVRPFEQKENVAVLPADGRYLAYENLALAEGFFVKGQQISLKELVNDPLLAEQYQEGSFLMARLCPTDYHRFHFPFDCTPTKASLIKGDLYSVNPLALKKWIRILTTNKRMITKLKSTLFGEVLFIEIGATYVGSIKQTHLPGRVYKKGEEKGYFEFGGSCLILLFEKGTIQFENDLLEGGKKGIEVRALMGQKMGVSSLG